MNLTEKSLKSPIGVAVGVGLIIVLGLVALVRLPVQLFPDIEEPAITIFTGWRAAAPTEVEAELIEPQEQALRGLAGLQEIQSFANAGGAFINLEFAIGTDMGRTLIDVIARMNQLPPLPRDADAPRISLGENGGGGPNETLSWFFVQLKPGTPGPVENYRREVEDLMRSRVESIPGVGTINVNAGAPDELRIEFDPYRAAELGIPIPSIVSVAGSADDVSGGFAELGRRQYTLRFAGRYRPDDLGELVLDWRDGRPVRLADVATISVERGDRNSLALQNNNPAIGIQILKESGADVLATLNAVKEEIGALREGPLAELGLGIEQSFDPSVFINQAIGLVTGNLVAGVILAIGVLWLFLRQFRSTLLVGIAIPVSVLATVLVMLVTGHTLNVISIAGIAFAVGMTLDAATIVLESILQRRERGASPAQAALEGATRVWPALFASTLTTVIVFIPVIFMKNTEGQLFADLALTISVAIAVSLVMAMTVLPVAAARWLKPTEATRKAAEWPRRLGERMAALTDSPRRRQVTIGLCLVVPAALTWLLMPPIDYLPPVKRDAIDGFFQFPPGMNIDAIETEVVEPMAKRLEPYMAGEKEPRLKNYYILIWPNGGGSIGVRPLDPSKIDELGKIVNEEITAGFPDLNVFAQQGNLFGGFGDGRNIEVRLQSADFDALLATAARPRIPVSVLATVLVMLVTGHTLNVISIAGIAFAVGMTLDAATIVLESILQRRERGASPAQAALEGATRVWPALFASTLTTVIVFIPVIFMKNTEGQLFADLALTISVAIAVSLVMAMTVLPVAAARWLKPTEATRKAAEWPRRLGERMAALTDSPRRRQLTIGLCLVVPARADLAAAAADRLPAAGQARRDRRLLPVPARHERGRDRGRGRASRW